MAACFVSNMLTPVCIEVNLVDAAVATMDLGL